MSTYERLISELAEGLGIDVAPDSDGIAELAAEGHIVLLRPDATGEREILAFATVASAPEGGFPVEILRRALEMNLFGRDVVGHHLGYFAGSLLLSANLPIEGLTAEDLADRILVLARLAGELSGRLSATDAVPAADTPPALDNSGFLAV